MTKRRLWGLFLLGSLAYLAFIFWARAQLTNAGLINPNWGFLGSSNPILRLAGILQLIATACSGAAIVLLFKYRRYFHGS